MRRLTQALGQNIEPWAENYDRGDMPKLDYFSWLDSVSGYVIQLIYWSFIS